MRLLLKIIASVLLIFNGIGALYGGLMMIIYPDGSGIHLPKDLLGHSIFNSYLMPGIVLLLVNGILSFYVFGAVLFNHKKLWRLVAFQGIVLIVWLIIQIFMILLIYFLHLIMFGVGLGLMSVGFFAKKYFSTDATYGEI
ncbi:hypothetical protein [Mucilaginibacter sp. BT774]|uniref:hypothetical protein n=1 Tax=Mucilaginibacter sp. BT774 TaxID=3062276 RepID=UPI00267728B6|nr:hypothetical protein [Mucilaginibacter sp. BT774]MDO3628234.1 hypothetical protein [Mucilaginibacter sp. BT774]